MDKKIKIYHSWEGLNQNIPYTQSDAKTLACLFSRLTIDEPYSQTESMYYDFLYGALMHQNNNIFNATFIATNDLDIIGFLNINVLFEQSEVDFIFVKKEQRKLGIALAMMKQFIDKFKISLGPPQLWGIGREILLEVGINNKNAICLYKKIGFLNFYTRKKYYKNEEDAIVMKKTID